MSTQTTRKQTTGDTTILSEEHKENTNIPSGAAVGPPAASDGCSRGNLITVLRTQASIYHNTVSTSARNVFLRWHFCWTRWPCLSGVCRTKSMKERMNCAQVARGSFHHGWKHMTNTGNVHKDNGCCNNEEDHNHKHYAQQFSWQNEILYYDEDKYSKKN